MPAQREKNEPFIVITCEEEDVRQTRPADSKDPMYQQWVDHGSAKFEDPVGWAVRKMRELYPGHAVVPFSWGIDLMGFPKAYLQPISPPEMISNLYFLPLARRMGEDAGVLIDAVRWGAFTLAWENYDYMLYTAQFLHGSFESTQSFLLHDGPEENARALLHAAGVWTAGIHEEIYVFDGGFWQKDHALWLDVQTANWEDVILKDEFKKNLQKDVFGFFDSEDLYKKLAIPWKRGVIMHGPPGNGKTISMKAIMKDADRKGYAPLYVKSFRSWKGEEGAMADVFNHARRVAPCVVVLEDLDSLINPGNRSFFLNQLDGLANNDGLLVIGTTNHLSNIDPALRNRPSRFDRKFLFDDPDAEERKLYIQYWQAKLAPNKDIEFPDSLVKDIADMTDKFSFAFLKEAFVSTLVVLAGYEDGDDRPTFASAIKTQITALKKQLNNGPKDDVRDVAPAVPGAWTGSSSIPRPTYLPERTSVASNVARQPRIYEAGGSRSAYRGGALEAGDAPLGLDGRPLEGEQAVKDGRDMRARAMAAAALGRSFLF